jgi:ABC-type branched-subunit amino acid transport system substrate-binding protein
MKRGVLVSVVIAVVLSTGALLAAGTPAGAQSSTTTAGGEPIKVAFIYPDLSKLQGSGFVVDVGDPEAQANAFVDALNDKGGINGRPVELSTYSYDVLAPDVLAAQRAVCLSATEDDKVMVVLAQALFDDPVLCVTKQHKTPLVTQTGTSTELIKRSEGRLFTTNLSWANDLKTGSQVFGKSLKGKTVGIIHLDESGLAADVETGLIKPLAKQGVRVAEKVVLPGTGSDETTAAIPAAIERLRTAGVDALFLAVNSYVASIFLTQTEQAGYHPTYYATDLDEVSTNIVPGLSPKGSMTGAQGVTWRKTGAAEAGETPVAFDEQCRTTYEEQSGKKGPAFGSDEYGSVAGTCALVGLFESAATKAGSKLTGASFVKALSTLRDFDIGGGAKGSYGPGRYDAPDAIRKLKLKESCTAPDSEGKSCWVPVGKVIPFEH